MSMTCYFMELLKKYKTEGYAVFIMNNNLIDLTSWKREVREDGA